MRKRSLKIFEHRKYIPIKDVEGNIIEEYNDEASKDEALIWPVTSKFQIEMYGLRANDIMNMHYYGPLSIDKHDMIIYDGISYKILSNKKFKRFVALEIERI